MKKLCCKVKALVVLAMLLLAWTATLSQAEQGDHEVKVNIAGLKTGVVTDIMAQAVVINGKAYGVTSDVVVMNQFGKTDGLDSLRRDLQVYFHLYEDKIDKSEKIDQLVLVIPH
jgi:hypothetical protein